MAPSTPHAKSASNTNIPAPKPSRSWLKRPLRSATAPSADSEKVVVETARRRATILGLCNSPPEYISATISAYNLAWDDLRKWLVEKFKDDSRFAHLLPRENEGLHGAYVLKLPSKMGKADMDAIEMLRKTHDFVTDPSRHSTRSPDHQLDDSD